MRIFGLEILGKANQKRIVDAAEKAKEAVDQMRLDHDAEVVQLGRAVDAQIVKGRHDVTIAVTKTRDLFERIYEDNRILLLRREADRKLIETLGKVVKGLKHEIKNAEYSRLIKLIDNNVNLRDV